MRTMADDASEKARIAHLKRELRAMHGPRRNVNLKLLGLVFLLLIAMVGAALYFRYEYSGLTATYKSKLDEVYNLKNKLDEATSRLAIREAEVEAMLESLNVSKRRESELGSRYINVTSAKERVESQLETAQKSISICEANLVTKRQELEEKQSELESYIKLYQSKVAELNTAKDTIAELHEDLADLQKQVNDMRANITKLSKEVKSLQERISDAKTCMQTNNELTCIGLLS